MDDRDASELPPARKERGFADRARVVLDASTLSGTARGAFLRREGVSEAELEVWRVSRRKVLGVIHVVNMVAATAAVWGALEARASPLPLVLVVALGAMTGACDVLIRMPPQWRPWVLGGSGGLSMIGARAVPQFELGAVLACALYLSAAWFAGFAASFFRRPPS